MKRVIGILFIFLLVFPSLIFPMTTNAKTLGDLKRELAELEAKMDENKHQQELTQEQLNAVYEKINQIHASIEQTQNDIIQIGKDIDALAQDIASKEQEIKEIIHFVQLSNGESAYLEYAFGAKDFTDFIYRVAISEQLTNYNRTLIDEHNQMIEQNKQKQLELKDKTLQLNQQQEQLQQQKAQLGNKLAEYSTESIDIDEQIRLQKEAIDLYENQLKCKDDEDISTCGRNVLPPGTAFYRPIFSGYTTSEFGSRCYMLHGEWTCDVHPALDFSTSGDNIPIYAAGTGMVIGTTWHAPCGGNMIYIHHNINGQTYTTLYAHLRAMYVEKGDVVTKDTQIGIMGGTSLEWWDQCAAGMHVHFSIANGLYLKDYDSWNTFESKMFNPRIMVNAPGTGVWFKDRITKY